MAATEPVTPSRTLAMSRPPMLFNYIEQRTGQLGSGQLLVALSVAEKRPVRFVFERVGHQPVSVGMLAGSLGNRQQVVVADADFEFELHQQAAMGPVLADLIDELRGSRQPQPKFRLIAFDFA